MTQVHTHDYYAFIKAAAATCSVITFLGALAQGYVISNDGKKQIQELRDSIRELSGQITVQDSLLKEHNEGIDELLQQQNKEVQDILEHNTATIRRRFLNKKSLPQNTHNI
jgi:predicted PurR-regulated permease PerM